MNRSFEQELEALREKTLLRRLREFGSREGTTVLVQQERLHNFSSNDYLGLADEPALKGAAIAALERHGVGSGASRLVCGTLAPHLELERKLAGFKRAPAALTFSSGYATALGTIPALVGREDVVIVDKLAHASLIDGIRLSGAVVRVFPHNHLGKLESHLAWAADHFPEGRKLVVTESVFSMDGDRAPLLEIVAMKKRHRALLLLDEAHAVGVLGAQGRGLADLTGVTDEVDIQMGTMSKALGVSGGYICGRRSLIDLLVNRARSFIYSTAPAPAMVAAAGAALDFLQSDAGEERRKTLWRNLELLRAALPEGVGPAKFESAIVPIILGPARAAVEASGELRAAGFFVPAIRYPTVAKRSARLRLTVSARHTPAQIEALARALTKAIGRAAS